MSTLQRKNLCDAMPLRSAEPHRGGVFHRLTLCRSVAVVTVAALSAGNAECCISQTALDHCIFPTYRAGMPLDDV